MFATGTTIAWAAITTSITSTVSSVATVASSITAVTALVALVVAGRRSFFSFDSHFGVAVGHRRSARQTHPALLIYTEAFDPDFIAHLDDVLGLLHSEIGEFADVDQTVFAWQEFDEGAEVLDRDDPATINLVYFGLGGHAHDGLAGDLHAFFGDRIDVNRAVVFDVDLATRFFDELLDVLAAGADQEADLFRVDLECFDAWRVLAQDR